MSITPLSAHFEKYFRVTFAYTPELLEQVWRVRYDVYCREFHFEREEDYLGGLERDDYDQYSLHCLLTHKVTSTPAGCVRLIKVPRKNPDLRLPLERFCGHSLCHKSLRPDQFPSTTVGEISRLAVHTMFRRRRGESASPLGSNLAALSTELIEAESRTFPLISIALIAASTSLMVLAQRLNIFIMAANWLVILLRRLGLDFVQVGDTIDYHGSRAAYFITADRVLQGMKGELREIYGYIHTNLEACARQAGIDLSD
jgi:N-acyl amino acid synthase of PEP-CTERM/exosortase system